VRLLAGYPHVAVEEDDFGNVIAHYRRGNRPTQYAFAAHMDHPGFVDGEFLGGVPEAYRAKNPPTRDFGHFAMWDLPACELQDGRIFSRACDDLIGCGTIVSMFDALESAGAECSVYGLFTRAEEVGFVGAIELAKSGRLSPPIVVISLETSSQLAGSAKMGAGVIVRVGDRTSIFDSSATGLFTELAKEKKIPFQRCLMSGGTCEATAFQLFGLRAAGLCVALGNYHNCAAEEKIAAEYVALDDVAAMRDLCVAIAQASIDAVPRELTMRAELEENARKLIRRFGR